MIKTKFDSVSFLASVLIHSAVAAAIIHAGVRNFFPQGTSESHGVIDINVVNKPVGAPVVSDLAQPALPEYQKKATEPAESEANKKQSEDNESPVIAKPKIKKVVAKAKVKSKPQTLPTKKTVSKPEDTKSIIDSTEEVLADKSEEEAEPVAKALPEYAPEAETALEPENGEEANEEAGNEIAQQSNAAPLPPLMATVAPAQVQARTDTQRGEVPPQFGTPGSVISESLLVPLPGNRNPNYSFMARLRKIQGRVTVRAYVSKDGEVKNLLLEKSSGHSILDDEVIASFSKWRYKANHNTGAWVIKSFDFRLIN